MAQFDVYENSNPQTKNQTPYLLDVQNNLLEDLGTRVVIPLRRNIKPIKNLHLEIEIEDQKFFLDTPNMAGIPTRLTVPRGRVKRKASSMVVAEPTQSKVTSTPPSSTGLPRSGWWEVAPV